MPKTVVFCCILRECADVFTVVKEKLGTSITKPPGILNIQQLWPVTLFTATSTPEM